MGNPGGPSRGCTHCKRSHVKCDETRPACSLCVRRKLSCGYKSDFELILVDQTVAVKENWRKKRRKARYQSTKPESDLSVASSPSVGEVEPLVLAQPASQRARVSSQMCTLGDPGNLALNVEQFALSFWLSHYFDLILEEVSPHGFLELQPQLYARVRPNSTLERATCALAYLSCSFNLQADDVRYRFFLMSRISFGDAMRQLREAIHNSEERTSDEILLAGMILHMVEVILAIIDRRTPSTAHRSGVLTLIKLRGSKNFSTLAAQRMLTGMHAELLDEGHEGPIRQSLLSSPHHAEQVANVQANVQATLASWDVLEDQRASELLTLLFKADQDLLTWEQDLPQHFRPIPAVDLSAANLTRFEAYGTHISTYANLSVANTQNSFRSLRIMLHLLICNVLHRLSIDRPSALPYGPTSHYHTIQRLVDEVCASVPFYLGTKRPGEKPEDVDFPHAPHQPLTEIQQAINMRLGICFVFSPLQICSRCPDLRPGQRQWIQQQTDRLESLHCQVGAVKRPFLGWQTDLRVLLRPRRLKDDKSL